ncbi:hypothetical protein SCOR_22945 [Sulfidibacter corallicola]|uniref:DUF5666 domain-containing protein n=1 Tax=Sulfidibacter corallicola TaxID=2818388 RepID=A0A8A4TTB7_SULCO|nr:hypothetical protein [Sulfidibacter corallicola]QTD52733.1 hypothetical protein J3U87_09675 [Sulfidibacter corallicola]
MKVATLMWILLLLSGPSSSGSGQPTKGATNRAGLLYAEVTMITGNIYRGSLRWGKEEAFWGDHFDSSKESLPYAKHIPDEIRRKKKNIKVLGVRVGSEFKNLSPSRRFTCRFGDIEQIIVNGSEDAIVHVKSGSMFQVRGYANDVGGQIRVWDEELGEMELDWRDLAKIEFIPVPKGGGPEIHRLHGMVTTNQGTYEGFIQWDLEECLSSDLLDGDANGKRHSIPMGDLTRIERVPGNKVRITRTSGEQLTLGGTNDVNDDNKGIMVENPDYGRVKIKWEQFKSLDFKQVDHTGPDFDEFTEQGRLRGSVTTKNGQKHQGHLVFDIDESETWELLDGHTKGVEYSIPFVMVDTLEPTPHHSKVRLKSGLELTLNGTADVTTDNLGLLVISAKDAEPLYLEWTQVERINLD